ncbi:nickel pincer cofactor biosynthesis protein LarB [Pararhizobium haloflavum]|uniref:nickel pincer cofactor biosynthesis protein LarB n=1 Tax=Pararhizobium haloflavum TaxID=2037914 RepID=UPI000C1A14E5|nr:nickel pincer cofactor biosynthesis protein LarB [Pararhizobium haloflavum]
MRDDILLDLERERRIGFDEAVYAAGKSGEQLEAIVQMAVDARTPRLFTRLDEDKLNAMAAQATQVLDYDPVSRTAFYMSHEPIGDPPRVAVVLAGSSDVPVGAEVARTLEFYGHAVRRITDVGVAGLWRLLARIDELSAMDVVIVAAGMEGALPSVIGGLVPGAVIAVPTSVGYGVSAGGKAALSSALASCAPGIVTVNIDNGYGAACAALRAMRAAHKAG